MEQYRFIKDYEATGFSVVDSTSEIASVPLNFSFKKGNIAKASKSADSNSYTIILTKGLTNIDGTPFLGQAEFQVPSENLEPYASLVINGKPINSPTGKDWAMVGGITFLGFLMFLLPFILLAIAYSQVKKGNSFIAMVLVAISIVMISKMSFSISDRGILRF